MKRFFRFAFTAFVAVFLCSQVAFCDDTKKSSHDKTITLTTHDSKLSSRPRARAYIPIQAEYNGFMNSILITLTRELDNTELVIENHTTGEYLSGTLSGEVGTQMIPISGTEGFYTITFTLQNGTQYYGEFEI